MSNQIPKKNWPSSGLSKYFYANEHLRIIMADGSSTRILRKHFMLDQPFQGFLFLRDFFEIFYLYFTQLDIIKNHFIFAKFYIFSPFYEARQLSFFKY
mgnify:CR=1 FL=1